MCIRDSGYIARTNFSFAGEANRGAGYVRYMDCLLYTSIDGFDEFAADGRQVEVEEICVGTLQIIHKGGNGKITFIAAVRVWFFADKVGYGEECRAIDALCFADVLHALVSLSLIHI